MVLLDEDIYQETREIVLGQREKTPLLIELADWLMQKYSIKMLNFQFAKLKGPSEKRYRLYIIVTSKENMKRMHIDFRPNADYQEQIANKFRKLSIKHRYTDKEKLENLFVTFNDYSDEAMTLANWSAIEEAREEIKNKYSSVWDLLEMFSSTVVFYYLETQIKENAINEVSEKIKTDYYKILKKYDELNYYTTENLLIKFDSKENLDENYQGSIFRYSR